MTTLTESGSGVVYEFNGTSGEDLARQLQQLIDTYKFVVIKKFSTNLDDVRTLMSSLGPLNKSADRDNGVLKLDTSQANEVLRSAEALPLHKDGILTVCDVKIVGIYCVKFQNISGGRTYITDSSTALEHLPHEHVELLKKVGFEGLPVDDTGYYAKDAAEWHAFKAFIPDETGTLTLNIGMPHMPGEKEGWKVRIPTVSEELSDDILYNMIRLFSNPPYVYYHDWEEEDLLLFDNCKVLHGRERFSGGPRELANLQVIRQ